MWVFLFFVGALLFGEAEKPPEGEAPPAEGEELPPEKDEYTPESAMEMAMKEESPEEALEAMKRCGFELKALEDAPEEAPPDFGQRIKSMRDHAVKKAFAPKGGF